MTEEKVPLSLNAFNPFPFIPFIDLSSFVPPVTLEAPSNILPTSSPVQDPVQEENRIIKNQYLSTY